ncbi:hypothetical protein [Pontibacter amylolyticus]|uniref:Uncharacterized protein n=1 Tax=Pontibacter amylolyticus TaxID=1424080 RepID=A0ABQ1VXJ6_9BACT|nr:hypothetical protein [Pontibacter amylolyticus]GGG04464.1 hypothetical protein GCM10011323_06540 [Pontibacter amylolyticus]
MNLNLILLNAGSPMMWFGLFHLLIINAAIGVVESRLLIRLKVENRTWLIVLANYVSMVAGLFFIAPLTAEWLGNTDFWGNTTSYGNYQMQGFFFGMGMAFIATVILELPLFAVALREKQTLKKLSLITLKVNGITYILMLSVYSLINLPGSKW